MVQRLWARQVESEIVKDALTKVKLATREFFAGKIAGKRQCLSVSYSIKSKSKLETNMLFSHYRFIAARNLSK